MDLERNDRRPLKRPLKQQPSNRLPNRDDLIRRTEKTIEEQLEGMLHIRAVGGDLEELLTERYRKNLRAAAEMVYELYIPW
jgi:hypothetical protein